MADGSPSSKDGCRHFHLEFNTANKKGADREVRVLSHHLPSSKAAAYPEGHEASRFLERQQPFFIGAIGANCTRPGSGSAPSRRRVRGWPNPTGQTCVVLKSDRARQTAVAGRFPPSSAAVPH